MRILCVDFHGEFIPVGEFFAAISEFSQNRELANQTSRILRALTRHGPDALHLIAKPNGDAFEFELSGANHTYTLVSEMRGDALVLTALY